jgi:hypothetical protein
LEFYLFRRRGWVELHEEPVGCDLIRDSDIGRGVEGSSVSDARREKRDGRESQGDEYAARERAPRVR